MDNKCALLYWIGKSALNIDGLSKYPFIVLLIPKEDSNQQLTKQTIKLTNNELLQL